MVLNKNINFYFFISFVVFFCLVFLPFDAYIIYLFNKYKSTNIFQQRTFITCICVICAFVYQLYHVFIFVLFCVDGINIHFPIVSSSIFYALIYSVLIRYWKIHYNINLMYEQEVQQWRSVINDDALSYLRNINIHYHWFFICFFLHILFDILLFYTNLLANRWIYIVDLLHMFIPFLMLQISVYYFKPFKDLLKITEEHKYIILSFFLYYIDKILYYCLFNFIKIDIFYLSLVKIWNISIFSGILLSVIILPGFFYLQSAGDVKKSRL